MGSDDRNEGGGLDECAGHVWVLAGVTLAGDGAYIEQRCTSCDAVLVVGPDELTGRVG